MGIKPARLLKNIFLSVGCFYILAAIGTTLYIKDRPALSVAKLRTLNRLMPPLAPLVQSNRSAFIVTPELLPKYTFYYDKVTDYLPDNPNGYFMKGYCLALEDQRVPAVRALEESIDRNPHYFWSYYNLGVLHLKAGEWELAEEAFRAAAAVNPTATVKIIFASKVFQQLLAQVDSPQQVIPAGLKSGYQDCHRWIAVIDRLKALGQKELPPQIYNQLRVRIF